VFGPLLWLGRLNFQLLFKGKLDLTGEHVIRVTHQLLQTLRNAGIEQKAQEDLCAGYVAYELANRYRFLCLKACRDLVISVLNQKSFAVFFDTSCALSGGFVVASTDPNEFGLSEGDSPVFEANMPNPRSENTLDRYFLATVTIPADGFLQMRRALRSIGCNRPVHSVKRKLNQLTFGPISLGQHNDEISMTFQLFGKPGKLDKVVGYEKKVILPEQLESIRVLTIIGQIVLAEHSHLNAYEIQAQDLFDKIRSCYHFGFIHQPPDQLCWLLYGCFEATSLQRNKELREWLQDNILHWKEGSSLVAFPLGNWSSVNQLRRELYAIPFSGIEKRLVYGVAEDFSTNTAELN
jgi:hypothetical protein